MRVIPEEAGAVGRRLIAARRTVRGVLARPLISFHLVVGLSAVLSGLGLVVVLSASSIDSLTATGNPYGVFEHQLVYCALGVVAFCVALRPSPERWRAWSAWLLLASLVGLVAVLVPGLGASVAGARKWFVVAGISLQPSEPAKLALVLWGAHLLAARRRVLEDWRRALLPLVPVALLVAGLVVLQPDLGSAICIVIILFSLLWFAPVSMRLIAALGAGAAGSVVMLAMGASYRMQRLTSFLSPDTVDPLGPGYQARQALYALGDGGLFGVGLGQGTAQWNYLPNASNDFVFAVLGEQLGMVGAVAVLALYGLLGYTGLRIASRSDDLWTRVAVATLTALLVSQAMINVGYVLGLLPVTGITLPLLSSGGSSVVVTMACLGIMAAAARREPAARVALDRRPRGARRIGALPARRR